jgi:hypothetical protein
VERGEREKETKRQERRTAGRKSVKVGSKEKKEGGEGRW